MDEKENEQNQEHQGLGFGTICWVVGALLVLYVLSVGPVAKVYHAKPRNAVIDAIYKPLELVYHRSALAKRFFDWYLEDVWRTK